MSRILRQPTLAPSARSVDTLGLEHDPAVRALVDRVRDEAYQRGRAEGQREGRQQAVEDVQSVAQALAGSLGESLAELRDLADRRSQDTEHILELAVRIAEAVVGEVDPDGAQGVVHRARQAIAALDDRPLTVTTNPAHVAVLEQVVAAETDIDVEADPALAVGEARIHGAWGEADLRWPAVWDAVREAIDRA